MKDQEVELDTRLYRRLVNVKVHAPCYDLADPQPPAGAQQHLTREAFRSRDNILEHRLQSQERRDDSFMSAERAQLPTTDHYRIGIEGAFVLPRGVASKNICPLKNTRGTLL